MKTRIYSGCTFLFLLFGSSYVTGQQHPSLDNFYVIASGQKMQLHWTISSGTTCDGTRIFRSADTIMFSEIGEVEGICGSSSAPVSYDFIDANPIFNRKSYYRIELGGIGKSNWIETELIQLSMGSYLIRPNPVINEANIYFENTDDLSFKFVLTDMTGRVMYEEDGIRGDNFTFYRGSLPNGIYQFTLQHNSSVKVIGRIVI